MKKKHKKVIGLIVILIIVIILVLLLIKPFNKKDKKVVKVIDSLDKYNYVLEDRDTALYKESYKELKTLLKEKDINYEEYAKTLVKLYIIDLYTLKNKVSKYDVGGAEFVHPDYQENYKLKVEDTMYSTIENNINNKRKQNLPVVKSVNIDGIEEITYKIGEEETEGYKLNVSWDYEEDLEYDKEAQVVVIKKSPFIYIVEQKELEKEE